MRKVLVMAIIMVVMLYGCSIINVKGEKELSFEEKIKDLLMQHDISNDLVINMEIKDNYIYVTALKDHDSKKLYLSVMKKEKNDLRWIMGEELYPPTTSIADKDGPVMTIIKPDDTDHQQIKSIKVFGEPTKTTIYEAKSTTDYAQKIMFWTYFSEETPDWESDVEVIKKD